MPSANIIEIESAPLFHADSHIRFISRCNAKNGWMSVPLEADLAASVVPGNEILDGHGCVPSSIKRLPPRPSRRGSRIGDVKVSSSRSGSGLAVDLVVIDRTMRRTAWSLSPVCAGNHRTACSGAPKALF